MIHSGAAAPAAPRVVTVVVTYNSAAVVEGCLRALPAALAGTVDAGVVVADNASGDDTLERVRRCLPAARVVRTGGNLGYAAAINAALRAAPDHDAVLVLNPDTVPQPGCAARLAAALRTVPGAGIAVPRMQSLDGSTSYSLRRAPTLRTALAEAVLGGRGAGRLDVGEVVRDPRRYERPGEVAWATGAAVLIATACRRAVGPWDERFLLYSEETDYMLRARDAGFLTWYVPEAVVAHRGGESATSPFLWSLVLANKVRLYRQRHGPVAGALYRLVLLAGEGARAALGKPRSRAAARLLSLPGTVPSRLPD